LFVFFHHKTFKTYKTATLAARNRLPPEAAGWRASRCNKSFDRFVGFVT
jgi:hypothetical protein